MDMIAWGLNRDAVTTRRESHWTVWSISRILHNPVYAGHLRWDDLVVSSEHTPIITIETYNEVQKLIASKVKNRKYRSYHQLPTSRNDDGPNFITKIGA